MSQKTDWETLDLVQHQIVSAVAAQQKQRPKVCFKGGTLLRACWQHDYRYSEDLDFDWLDSEAASKDAIHNFFAKVTSRASKQFGGAYSVRWGAHNMRLDWVFDDQSGAIKVDIKFRGEPQAEPTYREWEIIGRYPKIPTAHKIFGYSLESVMSAKLVCIVAPDRRAGRDCYDLYRLMNATGINRDAVLEEFVACLRVIDSSFRVGDDAALARRPLQLRVDTAGCSAHIAALLRDRPPVVSREMNPRFYGGTLSSERVHIQLVRACKKL